MNKKFYIRFFRISRSKVGKLLENRGFLIEFCDLEKNFDNTIWKYLISLNLRNLTLLNMI